MRFFKFQNINFHYECEGKGIPLLFLHGLGGDMKQGEVMLRKVKNIFKIMMDIRGHGKTPLGPIKKLTFNQFREDAMALIRHLKVKNFIVGGISMGSGIAINITLAFPEKVKGLILIRPAWLNKPKPLNLKEHEMVGKLLRDMQIKEARNAFINSKEYKILKEKSPSCANSLLGQFDSPNAKGYFMRLIQIVRSVPFSKLSDLSKIKAKTLILSTNQDPVHPFSMAEDISRYIRKSNLVKVTSKSKDAEKHLADCVENINNFLNKITKGGILNG